MIHNLLVLTAMLILPLIADPATRPSSEPALEPPADLIQADSIVQGFVRALRDAEWQKALADCSPKVQGQAKQYPSPEAFFRSVVPLQKLISETKNPIYKPNPHPGKSGPWVMWALVVKVAEVESEPDVTWPGLTMSTPIYWQWRIDKVNSRWIIDFPTTPFQKYVDQGLAERRRLRAERVANEKALDPILRGVRTRLTALDKQFKAGQSMPFRLELINDGFAQLLYEDDRVGLYCSMIAKDEQGKLLPCSLEPVQTFAGITPIQSAETVVLLDHWDLGIQYKLTKPGRYTVQFSGRGLHISEADPHKNVFVQRHPSGPPQTQPAIGRTASRLFPSNIVEIEVVSTQPE